MKIWPGNLKTEPFKKNIWPWFTVNYSDDEGSLQAAHRTAPGASKTNVHQLTPKGCARNILAGSQTI